MFSSLSAGLLILDYRYQYLEDTRRYLASFVQPLHYLIKLPNEGAHFLYNHIRSNNELIAENERLRQQNLRIGAKLMQTLTLEHENSVLRDLLQSPRKKIERRVLVAELIGVSPTMLEQKIIINKGERDRVYRDQPVLDANGIIGQVTSVTYLNATVTLISNPGHSLLGQINRSGVRVLVSGTGSSERLELNYVPVAANVRVGDEVFASGLGDRFPAGYPVATITDIKKEDGDIFSTVYAKPTANLGYSYQMLLVWPDENDIGQLP